MDLQSKEDLLASLQSKAFREAFVSSRVSNTLALQIRAMRQERGWSQAYLAERLGTSQNAVWRLESPQYGKHSLTTLKRLAAIFDVGLAVWFLSFGKLVDWVLNLSTEDILVPCFSEDQGIYPEDAGVVSVQATNSQANHPLLAHSWDTPPRISGQPSFQPVHMSPIRDKLIIHRSDNLAHFQTSGATAAPGPSYVFHGQTKSEMERTTHD
jgi:transcriptional regulator with XRE-family HTH domain